MTMQYYGPADPTQFVGDCMPFYHNGVFHLYYLLDEGHHRGRGGIGGHQWAHVSSQDLIHWTHHPLALPLTEEWEGSICTGSVMEHDGTFYAFYPTRKYDRTQHLGLATSDDATTFRKTEPNPFASAPRGYDPRHFRDPFPFFDATDESFHLIVTSMLDPAPVPGRGGCLAHLSSKNLCDWDVMEPLLVPGLEGAPECPDLFCVNGIWYLTFGIGLVTHYRVSDSPYGPWARPPHDVLGPPRASVMKTAPFGVDRRIGVAWLGEREEERNDGKVLWAGNAVLYEVIQRKDGSLGVHWPREAVPRGAGAPSLDLKGVAGATYAENALTLSGTPGLAAARLSSLPTDYLLHLDVARVDGAGSFGLRLFCGESLNSGVALSFHPGEGRVELGDTCLTQVTDLDDRNSLNVAVVGSIVDVEIGGQRCILNRLPERDGGDVYLWALDCQLVAHDLAVESL